MYRLTLLLFVFMVGQATAQTVDFEWKPSPIPTQDMIEEGDIPPYALGLQGGAPSVVGPADLDNDGNIEVILSDYSGGGRVHILESSGVDTWELIYSSPTLNPTSGTTANARGVGFGDLDGDDLGEFYIFLGYDIDASSPIKGVIPGPRLVVLEAMGDNLFANLPNVWDFDGSIPDRFLTEQITTADVDGDGIEELLFGNNGEDNIYDSWYVINAQSLGTPFAAFEQEARWTTRSDSIDSVDRGGGSPFGIVPADLDGDNSYELALTSWNNLNFTNVDVTGINTYTAPSGENAFYMASDFDDVAYFGCTVVDMDRNGDDEVYCPSYEHSVALINYEDGENPLEITSENVVYPLKGFPSVESGLNYWGLTHGDIDKDGVPELIGSGDPYTPEDYQAGSTPKWVRIWDYDGEGDIENPESYKIREIEFPMPAEMIFDTVNRDSAGVKSTYYTTTYIDDQLGAGGVFAGKFAYLGDVDEDGHDEVAMSISGIPDSIYVYSEVWNPSDSTYTRTTTSKTLNPQRVYLKVLSSDGISTRISNDRVILPTDFELRSNYPNPFNPSTNFSFVLPLDKRISVRVYDMTGRLVRTLINDEVYVQGTHLVTWNGLNDGGSAVASGQYIYTLEWGQFRQAKRMVLIK